LLAVDPPWREQGGAAPEGAPTGRWRPGAGEEEIAEGRVERERKGMEKEL
jgi:hypothetical protein